MSHEQHSEAIKMIWMNWLAAEEAGKMNASASRFYHRGVNRTTSFILVPDP